MNTRTRLVALALLCALIAAACGGSDSADTATTTDTAAETESSPAPTEDPTPVPPTIAEDEAAAPAIGFANEEECPTITLATYDSFAISEGTFKTFTDETCIVVEQIAAGDAGQMVSSAVLTKDNPTADVLFGIDTTFLQRGLDAGIFEPYESPGVAAVVDPALQLDPERRVTPIQYGDVCVNYFIDAIPGEEPTSLDDLIDPANTGQFVTQNPETSSPGFSFLLATIAKYGDGWEGYWQSLVDNDVSITPGWSEAYYEEFAVVGGPRSMVTSYASSPPAEVFFAAEPIDSPPTAVLYDSCFRSVEFAGILAGSDNISASQQLIDFMLSTTFQEDIPWNMFVYPANSQAELPTEFVEFGQLAENPASLTPAEIEANREAWTERWVEIVLS